MVKSYLRYEHAAAFSVIASLESNICYDSSGKFLLSPALDKVAVWHVRQAVCSKTLTPSPPSHGPSPAVTSIVSSPSSSLVAVGYVDGSIRIWDLGKGTCQTTLNGHKGAVTALRYNKTGSMLASGSKDNDIILWDVVGETGLYRLRGHRDQVTDLLFLDSGKKLVSSSKDKFVRVWDLDTQHCMQIISGHHSEIWSIDCDPDERFVVTGSSDLELRFYTIIKHDLEGRVPLVSSELTESVNNGHTSTGNKWEVLKYFGEIQRMTKDRVANLRFNKIGNLLACQVAGKTVEIYRMLDDAESKRKAKRRVNRKKEKKGKKDDKTSKDVADSTENGDEQPSMVVERSSLTIVVSDVFKLLQTLRCGKKICSTSFCPINPKNSLAILALSLNNNSIEIYSVGSDSSSQTQAIELQGHRSDIRSLSLSPDNSLLLSTSHNAVKIWNPSTCNCLRTVDSGFGLCSMFVPGEPSNKYALVGTKGGTIEIIDVASATCVEVVEAHGGSIQSIAGLPDRSGFVTGSADHDVKFWEYRKSKKSGDALKCLTVSNVRTMKMNDDVLKVVLSPDAKYIAVALLDCTVKVFFVDTLKFFLTLYGHKLPVLCMDISSDGDLIVTGSIDKNLKIWGLDFGDCHKSIFAHADSVMDVKFVPNTHYVFSVGKDRLLKYWDADKFELLLTLEGHHAEIWCLALSSRGDYVVTGSHDRSIRRWDRTDEPFFIEEEKEKRLEEMFEADIDNASENIYASKDELPEEGAVASAGRKTQETLTATDLIIESLDMAEAELKRIAEYEEEKTRGSAAKFQPNILMLGLSPCDYVLRSISKVQPNDLEQTLLALPFSDALKLLSFLKNWTTDSERVELICRVAIVLLQTNYHQLISTPSARPVLTNLKDVLHGRVKDCKDTLGFNLAAMGHLKQLMAMKSDAPFRDAKTKLLEIRTRIAKRNDGRAETREERKKKKKQKKGSDGHAWTVVQ
ncbi:uncharacterized protein LOC130827253 [Amaranthus tricolor]|uniref:uncharacterized protein LOC130827253 n=1 Tax=Amaranthus tricolor TaxID=29722 RepID=UPI00258E3296|nr:uncharacterized protein LOC130827253 [Amaranthus tricolor]XP_057548901.1 uncharacterized protein LOC130827253 [Amaranthus tricolor]